MSAVSLFCCSWSWAYLNTTNDHCLETGIKLASIYHSSYLFSMISCVKVTLYNVTYRGKKSITRRVKSWSSQCEDMLWLSRFWYKKSVKTFKCRRYWARRQVGEVALSRSQHFSRRFSWSRFLLHFVQVVAEILPEFCKAVSWPK